MPFLRDFEPMRNVSLPAAELPQLTRSVVACLASILEVDPAVVPTPPGSIPSRGRSGETGSVSGAWVSCRSRSRRGSSGPDRGLPCCAPTPTAVKWPRSPLGSPPGLAWNPLDDAATFDDVEAGYLIAPADVALWAPVVTTTARTSGRVEALALAEEGKRRCLWSKKRSPGRAAAWKAIGISTARHLLELVCARP